MMTCKEFVEDILDVFEVAGAIVKKKNADYSGDADPFKNFKLCDAAGLASVEQGIMVRMFDKMGRISTLLGKEDSAQIDESIDDTLMDLINYAAILIVYRKSKHTNI